MIADWTSLDLGLGEAVFDELPHNGNEPTE